jgi:hypothetical protein
MYDGNPVHIHTGRYTRGIDVSNFKGKFQYFVPEERFFGGGVHIWPHLFLTFSTSTSIRLLSNIRMQTSHFMLNTRI